MNSSVSQSLAFLMASQLGDHDDLFQTPVKAPNPFFNSLLGAPLKKYELTTRPSMFDEAPDVPVLNNALKQIGLDVLELYFKALYGYIPDVPVVSIGSGNGHVERQIEKRFGKQIYCVDPNHVENTNQDLYKTSEYDNVFRFLDAHPECKSHSTTFVNWSTPNDSTYDYEAIRALDSDNVLIVFESTGSGGGTVLQKWLNYCGVVTDNEPTESEAVLYGFPKYTVVKSTLSRVENPPTWSI
jgi:hypothetical protein